MAPFFRRLVQPIPDPQGRPVIWIHGVSVGEIKSAQSLYVRLKKDNPQTFFLVTTTTSTGQVEARRSFPGVDAICYLPLDLPWIVSCWAKRLRPELFILLETDFWPFLLRAIVKQDGKNVLVSGRISERSACMFQRFLPWSRKIFDLFSLLCVQNEEYKQRFFPLVSDPSRLHITGNLKFDLTPQSVDVEHWQQKIEPTAFSLTIACTHAPEEEQILFPLLKEKNLFFFLAPRHPERFNEVARLLDFHQIPYVRFTQLEKRIGKEKVLLVDAMGQLPICYSFSRLAVLGGSFVPIGGHNLLEPCLYGVPVLFGPHMHTQVEMASLVINAKAGLQVSLTDLAPTVHRILNAPSLEQTMRSAAQRLIEQTKGSLQKTYTKLLEVGKKESVC